MQKLLPQSYNFSRTEAFNIRQKNNFNQVQIYYTRSHSRDCTMSSRHSRSPDQWHSKEFVSSKLSKGSRSAHSSRNHSRECTMSPRHSQSLERRHSKEFVSSKLSKGSRSVHSSRSHSHECTIYPRHSQSWERWHSKEFVSSKLCKGSRSAHSPRSHSRECTMSPRHSISPERWHSKEIVSSKLCKGSKSGHSPRSHSRDRASPEVRHSHSSRRRSSPSPVWQSSKDGSKMGSSCASKSRTLAQMQNHSPESKSRKESVSKNRDLSSSHVTPAESRNSDSSNNSNFVLPNQNLKHVSYNLDSMKTLLSNPRSTQLSNICDGSAQQEESLALLENKQTQNRTVIICDSNTSKEYYVVKLVQNIIVLCFLLIVMYLMDLQSILKMCIM